MYTSLTIMNIILEGEFCFTETEWICKTSLWGKDFDNDEFDIYSNLIFSLKDDMDVLLDTHS